MPSIHPYRKFVLSDAGDALIEFGVAFLPLIGLLLLSVDVAWAIFARATLQHAVREGVRFAITGQISAGNACLNSSVQQIVAQNSFGFIPAAQAGSYVTVSYYTPTNLTPVTGSGSTAGGNVVQVTVSGISIHSLGPIWHSASPIPLQAMASDVMESPPNGIPPCP
jgi:Flp pilus assembly protein TadG